MLDERDPDECFLDESFLDERDLDECDLDECFLDVSALLIVFGWLSRLLARMIVGYMECSLDGLCF